MSDLLSKLQLKYNKPKCPLIAFARLVDAVDLIPLRRCANRPVCYKGCDCARALQQKVREDLLLQRLDLLDVRINQPTPCRCTQWSTCFLSWSRMVECGRVTSLQEQKYAKLKPAYAAINKLEQIIRDDRMFRFACEYQFAKGTITTDQLLRKMWMRPQLVTT